MVFTKTLVALCLSAVALADVAAPANFCRRLVDQSEKERCKADRLQYCRKLNNGTREKAECQDNRDGSDIYGQPSRGGGSRPPPRDDLSQCDLLRWGDMTNACIRACELNPGYNSPPWCVRHCDNSRRKNERLARWC